MTPEPIAVHVTVSGEHSTMCVRPGFPWTISSVPASEETAMIWSHWQRPGRHDRNEASGSFVSVVE